MSKKKYKKRYIIVVPAYGKSNGVKVLYKLSELLREQGYEAFVFAPKAENSGKYKYLDNITRRMREKDIVVYPEIVTGNPLGFRHVVRWVLYFPGVLGGEKSYAPSEKVFTFAKTYMEDADLLTISNIDEKLFYYDGTKKDTDCYFVYKGGKWKEVEELNSMTEINMSYPEKREDLANLLRRTKTLYSYDKYSLLLDEAVCCGCKVKIIEKDGFSDYVSDIYIPGMNYDEQLQNFINKTQAMNLEGGALPRFEVSLKTRIKLFIYKYINKNKAKFNKYRYGFLWE